MFSRYILLILFFFCWSGGSAQSLTDKLFFEHLTTEDGLSHNYVQSIYQDKDGFIWLGSDNGLNRYDGQHIDIFSTNTQPTLGGNKIRRIVQDRNKNLWILHENGLDKMKYSTQQVKSFLYDKKQSKRWVGIGIDRKENLIAYTEKKIFRYDIEKDTLLSLQDAPQEYRYSAYIHTGGKNYVGTRQHGVIVYDEDWQLLEHIYPRSIEKGPLTDGLINV